jgi:hypothetical protein
MQLVYRGMTYEYNPPAVASPEGTIDVNACSRRLMIKHQFAIKARQQSMLTRLADQVGLPLQNASSYWNRIQGKVHPSFRLTYDRSAATMS